MVYIFIIGFIGLNIGIIIYGVKRQLRLINELKNSKLLQDLLENGYKLVDKKSYIGNHLGYQSEFYYNESPRDGLTGYARIQCDIPFVHTKGGVKKMMAFSKMYRQFGFAIDSKTGFIKEMNMDFLLNLKSGEILKIFDEMVSAAEKEGFEPIK